MKCTFCINNKNKGAQFFQRFHWEIPASLGFGARTWNLAADRLHFGVRQKPCFCRPLENLPTFGQIGSLQNIAAYACLAETFKNLASKVAKLSAPRVRQQSDGKSEGNLRTAFPGHQMVLRRWQAETFADCRAPPAGSRNRDEIEELN